MSWAAQYIGKPYAVGGAGPEVYDCWGLVRWVQQAHFGITVPVIEVDAHDVRACIRAFSGHGERARWVEVVSPKPGDCLLMSQNKQPTHVGVWVADNGGAVLHAVMHAGVVLSRRVHLRGMGYNVLGIYRCAQR